MYKIYYNPACSKCRSVLAILNEHDIDPAIISYLETGITKAEIVFLAGLLAVNVRDLLRASEPVFRELDLGGFNLSDDEIIHAIIDHPVLLQRPVVIRDDAHAVIARPPEAVLALLD